MKDKKSIVLYCDLIYTVNQLPDDKAGLLFKHILSYVNDEEPVTDDIIVKIAFEPIKQQLKRDLIKYEKKREQYSEAGKKSAEVRRIKKLEEENDVNEIQQTLTNVEKRSTNSTVSVSVNDNVNVNVIVNDINKREQDFSKSLQPYLSKYGKDLLNNFYLYWTEKKPNGKKMRFEMEKVFDVKRRLGTWSKRNTSFYKSNDENTGTFDPSQYNN